MTGSWHADDEWLETDGLGGFASGTASGIRTRRYHALLLSAATPPTGRFALVNGVEAWVERDAGNVPISTHRYAPDVLYPDGASRLVDFCADPWPRWIYDLGKDVQIVQEAVVEYGRPRITLVWRLRGTSNAVRLFVRPLLSGRDYHALHRANDAFRFDATTIDGGVRWHPYTAVPAITAHSNGEYVHEPRWYRDFLYSEEAARGFEATEDIASPGTFVWELAPRREAVLILEAETGGATRRERASVKPLTRSRRIRSAEKSRRSKTRSQLDRAVDAYLVTRGSGRTIIAGYPWFTDWGRDTFISIRGLCFATGRLDTARGILIEWADAVSEGMLPNRFVDSGEEPEYNAVDASLWFIVAAVEYLRLASSGGAGVETADREKLEAATHAILSGYADGTRYGIHADDDGLLAAGVSGVQLTWMDARIGDWVVTPRIGKPVEIQALWINALRIGADEDRRWRHLHDRALASFGERFWSPDGYLYDVVDVDGRPGAVDTSFRPNQVFAIGGLPVAILDTARAASVIDAVEARLLTPLGLRSLAPDDPDYAPRYEGGPVERDSAYHQGTVWPWLIGPFVEAWVRVRNNSPAAIREARSRFLPPLIAHLDSGGLGHISEIADGDPPHTPRGCPFQAWSLAEAIRLDRVVLSSSRSRRSP